MIAQEQAPAALPASAAAAMLALHLAAASDVVAKNHYGGTAIVGCAWPDPTLSTVWDGGWQMHVNVDHWKADPADILDDDDDEEDEAGPAAVGGGGGGRGRQSSSKKKKGSAEEKVRLRDDPEARAEMTEMFGQGI